MTDITNIQQRVDFSNTKFQSYLRNLVGLGKARATQEEIQLFDLLDSYTDDNKLELNEIRDIIVNLKKLDINQLVKQGIINVNEETNKIEVSRNNVDINADGRINTNDKDALEYVLNFADAGLDDLLGIIGDKSAINNYLIEKWAKEKGIEENASIISHFKEYANGERKTNINNLKTLFQIYNSGIGKKDHNDLNAYLSLIENQVASRVINSLVKFENSESCLVGLINEDTSEEERIEIKKQLRENIAAAILDSNNDPERTSIITSAIVRKKIPLVDKDLTGKNILGFINNTKEDSKNAITMMRISQIVRKLKLTNDEAQDLEAKLDNEAINLEAKLIEYFNSKKYTVAALINLTKLYQRLKPIHGGNTLDALEIYAPALKDFEANKSSNLKYLAYLVKLEEKFGSEIREEKEGNPSSLQNYINLVTQTVEMKPSIETQENERALPFFLKALKKMENPITKEKIETLDQLDTFISLVKQENGYENELLRVNGLADTDILAELNKNDDFSTNNKISIINFLIKNKDADITEDILEYSAIALAKGASGNEIKALMKYYKESNEMTAEDYEVFTAVFSSDDKEKRTILARTLRSGIIPYTNLTAEEVGIPEIKNTLAKLSEENGYTKFRIEDIARKNGFDEEKTQKSFNEYVTTLMSWNVDNNLDLKTINKLATFTKKNSYELESMQVYADAYHIGLDSKYIASLMELESREDFDVFGAERDATINNYISIYTNENTSELNLKKAEFLYRSIKSNKIFYLEDNEQILNTDNLNNFLDGIESADDALNIESDHWARTLDIENPSLRYDDFKTKIVDLKNTGLDTQSISSSLRFLKNNKDIQINDFEKLALSLHENQNNYKALQRIYQFSQSNDYNISHKLDDFIRIIENKPLAGEDAESVEREKTILNQILRSEEIELTGKALNSVNLEDALAIARNEENYNNAEIAKLARDLGYKNSTTQYDKFEEFFQRNYTNRNKNAANIAGKVNSKTLRQLAYLYGQAAIAYDDTDTNSPFEKLTELVINHDLDKKTVRNFNKFVANYGLSYSQQQRYLDIMLGNIGTDAQKEFLLDSFADNRIPLLGVRLF